MQLLAGIGALTLLHCLLTGYGCYDIGSGCYSDVSYYLGRQFGVIMRPFDSLKTSESTSSASTSALTYDITACPGYKLDPTSIHATPSSFTAHLSLAGPPCNAFGRDIAELVLSVQYEEKHRLHVHIYDREEKQFQIPKSLLPRLRAGEGMGEGESDLEFKYDAEPFAFWIVRKRTGDIIFDTRASTIPTYHSPLSSSEGSARDSTTMPAHPLIFSDQYLQLSSSLPPASLASIYGLGEYYSGNYKRNASGTVQPFWALDIGDPVDANMYGHHAVYQDVRKNGDMHAVWLKNAAGMDVILRDGVIQYRAIGGTLDFYFYSGDESPSASTSSLSLNRRAKKTGAVNSAVTVIEQYVQSIGLPQVPPTWAFGYHQCRWGYANISELRDVVSSFRKANIPLETQWSDIDWMHAYRNFESDPVRYNRDDLAAFIAELHANHQHYIPIIDAAISVQIPNGTDRYDTAARGVEMGAFIMNDALDSKPGNEYVGIVWPGYTYFPDWWAENTPAWWTEAFRNMSAYMDFDGIWLDMNEPSSFCTGSCGTGADWSHPPPSVEPTEASGWPEGYDNNTFGNSGNITVNGSWTYNPDLADGLAARSLSFALEEDIDTAPMASGPAGSVIGVGVYSDGRLLNNPPYAIHNAHGPIDASTVAANASTKLGPMYDLHNLNGFTESAHTHDTLLQLKPNKRPFIISRSTFSGSGKYAGHWLGDNASTWRDLWYSLQGVFQFQFFGIPMVGADTCGFAQNTDEELCNRWMAMSAWHPFFRNHNVLMALPQEPYRWDSVAEVSRKVLAARYRLLPVWQTLFARASSHGTPAIRTLWQEFPGRGYESADRQFLVGDSLLVTPVLAPNVTSVKGVFPAAGGPWRDFWTHEELDVQPNVNSTIPAPLSHINVHIRPGSILPMYRDAAYTTYETSLSPYALVVSLDDAGEADGELYYDDGETQWTHTAPGTTVGFAAADGSLTTDVTGGRYPVEQRLADIVILGVITKPSRMHLQGVAAQFSYDTVTKSLNAASLFIDLNQPFNLSWS